jgi:hypothetical protein
LCPRRPEKEISGPRSARTLRAASPLVAMHGIKDLGNGLRCLSWARVPPRGSAAAGNQRSAIQLEFNVGRHLDHSDDISGCDQLRAYRSRALDASRQIKRPRRIHGAPQVETEDFVTS